MSHVNAIDADNMNADYFNKDFTAQKLMVVINNFT